MLHVIATLGGRSFLVIAGNVPTTIPREIVASRVEYIPSCSVNYSCTKDTCQQTLIVADGSLILTDAGPGEMLVQVIPNWESLPGIRSL